MTEELILQRLAAAFGLVERSTWRRELVSALEQLGERRSVDRAHLEIELQADADLLRELAGHLTIDESHFLRHPQQFELLLTHLGSRLDRAPPGERLRVWSAGCAKGEEPYSVALLARERFDRHRAARIEIVANDINRDALDRARRAAYTPWSFRGVPEPLVRRYFTMTEAGHLALAPAVAATVGFEHASIQERLVRTPAAAVDAILFRNVAIYLEPAAIRAIYTGLHAALRPSGLLLIAPADPLPPAELFERSAEDVAGAFVRRRARTSGANGKVFAQLRFQAASQRAAVRVDADRAPASMPLAAGHGEGAGSNRSAAGPEHREPVASHSPSPEHDRGDRRRTALELDLASQFIATRPTAPHGYLMRGRLLLAQQRPAEAVDDFRRALFVGGDNRVARFWYAAALQRSGNMDRARSQAAQLAVQLAALPEDAVLEDGQTVAAGLLRAVELMRTSLG